MQTKADVHCYAVILAGGSGTRLWPLSRESQPKQLIPVLNGKSLMQIAFDRLEGVVSTENRWICGGAHYETLVRNKIPQLSTYIGEPQGRDTLAAIALSSALIAAKDPEALCAFLTSDHVINPIQNFQQALRQAYKAIAADPELLVTFGVKPQYAATAYGYLELSEELLFNADSVLPSKIQRVIRFKEKPNQAIANQYFKEGPQRWLWNSGMFVWKARRLLELCARYEPEMYNVVRIIAQEPSETAQKIRMAELYPTIKKISVDYGIMEPASQDKEVRIACIPLNLEWKDIGSWDAYGSLTKPDAQGNSMIQADSSNNEPPTLFYDSSHNIVVSDTQDHLLAILGCKNLVVVHTKDATFICPKNRVEDIKKLHADLRLKFKDKYL